MIRVQARSVRVRDLAGIAKKKNQGSLELAAE